MTFITTGEVAQVVPGATTYWVRLWAPPADPGGAWFVDEWQVSDASDALEVIEWARQGAAAEGGSAEVFVESTDHRPGPDSACLSVKQHVRIFGEPADDGGVSASVVFHAD
jgi:hypothetical protein